MKKNHSKGGFTLVEMLIAVSLFVVVVFVSIGALLSIFDANKNARSSKTVVDNLNLAIENMTRTVRFGKDYRCASSFSSLPNYPLTPADCSGGAALAVDFYDRSIPGNVVVTYEWDSTNKSIKRSYGGVYDEGFLNSKDTVIESLKFYVLNSSNSDLKQPYVVAVIKGYVGDRPTTQSSFTIETIMSQRELDI